MIGFPNAAYAVDVIVVVEIVYFQFLFRFFGLLHLLVRLPVNVAFVVVVVQRFPSLAANVAEVPTTPSWRTAVDKIASQVSFHSVLAKWTNLRVHLYPLNIRVILCSPLLPSDCQIAGTREVGLVLAGKTELRFTLALYNIPLQILAFYHKFAIWPNTMRHLLIKLQKTNALLLIEQLN